MLPEDSNRKAGALEKNQKKKEKPRNVRGKKREWSKVVHPPETGIIFTIEGGGKGLIKGGGGCENLELVGDMDLGKRSGSP